MPSAIGSNVGFAPQQTKVLLPTDGAAKSIQHLVAFEHLELQGHVFVDGVTNDYRTAIKITVIKNGSGVYEIAATDIAGDDYSGSPIVSFAISGSTIEAQLDAGLVAGETPTEAYIKFNIDTPTPALLAGSNSAGAGGFTVTYLDGPATLATLTSYNVDTTLGPFAVTLPAGSANTQILLRDATGTWGDSPLTVVPAAGQSIDQQAADETLVLDVAGTWILLVWDTVLGRWVSDDIFSTNAAGQTEVKIPKVTAWQTNTLVLTNAPAATNSSITWRQVGDSVEVQAYYDNSATSAVASDIEIDLVASIGLTFDNSKRAADNNAGTQILGSASFYNGGSRVPYHIIKVNPDALKFVSSTTSGSTVLQGDDFSTVGRQLGFKATLPVVEFAGDAAFDTIVLEAAAGSGGSAGKNYVLNPSAASGTDDVVADAGITLGRTTTLVELPEASVGSAFTMSGTGVTPGASKVAFACLATGIDAAEGGRYGSASVHIKMNGAASGDWSVRAYSVTQAAYISDSEVITGTGQYSFDVLFAGGDVPELHFIAEVPNPGLIAASSVTIEPVSRERGTVLSITTKDLISTVSVDTADVTELKFTGLTIGRKYQVSGNVQFTRVSTAVSDKESFFYVYNSTGARNETNTVAIARYREDATADTAVVIGLSGWFVAQDTELRVEVASLLNIRIDPVSANHRATYLSLAEFDTAPTVSDMLVENARCSVYLSSDQLGVVAATKILWDAVEFDTAGMFNPSNNSIVVPTDGYYEVLCTARLGAISTSARIRKDGSVIVFAQNGAANDQLTLRKVIYLEAGSELTTEQATSASNTWFSDTQTTYFSVTRIPDKTSRKASMPFPNGMLRLDTGNGHGSTGTQIRRFLNITEQVGDAFTYVDSATDGMSVTANRDMIVSCSYTDRDNLQNAGFGISLNASSLSTNLLNLTPSERIILSYTSGANSYQNLSVTFRVKKGDVIRAHTFDQPDATADEIQFVITEVFRY